jgi:hypothetical protein
VAGPHLEGKVTGELSHRTIKKIQVLDPRLFKPHEVKETDEWSWKRFKYEKWYVVFLKWKLTDKK